MTWVVRSLLSAFVCGSGRSHCACVRRREASWSWVADTDVRARQDKRKSTWEGSDEGLCLQRVKTRDEHPASQRELPWLVAKSGSHKIEVSGHRQRCRGFRERLRLPISTCGIQTQTICRHTWVTDQLTNQMRKSNSWLNWALSFLIADQKDPTVCETWRQITVFIRALHLTLSGATYPSPHYHILKGWKQSYQMNMLCAELVIPLRWPEKFQSHWSVVLLCTWWQARITL